MNFSKADLPDTQMEPGRIRAQSRAERAALISLSNSYLEHSLKERQAAQQRLFDARTQLLAAQNDEENMSAYALEYNSLLAQKVIGDEQRLDWMEGLEKLRQQGVVLDFKYTIAPQQSYAPNPPDWMRAISQLSRSSMTLQIDLLHEEQLLHLFADMRSK